MCIRLAGMSFWNSLNVRFRLRVWRTCSRSTTPARPIRTDFYIGRDKFGSNVIVDFNQRADDKTNANILILGNSGQGKSYLLKLIQTILRESGMKVICLDPEHEYVDLTGNLGGCFVDLMSGEYIINVLEPKTWDETAARKIQRHPMRSAVPQN